MGRREGGGSGWGSCTPMADPCQCMAKTTKYCKVISLQLKLKKRERNRKLGKARRQRNNCSNKDANDLKKELNKVQIIHLRKSSK